MNLERTLLVIDGGRGFQKAEKALKDEGMHLTAQFLLMVRRENARNCLMN